MNVVVGAAPVAVEGDEHALNVLLSDGTRQAADLIVVCAGIRPSIDLAAAAGIAVEHGVLVDEHMRTSDPAIYAAGDMAQFDGQVHGLWPVAAAQGEVAAANAVGDTRAYDPPPPVTILKGVGLAVMSIGELEGAPADEVLVRQSAEDDVRYWKLVVRDGTLAGAVLIGQWTESAAVVDAVAARAPIADKLAPLRAGDLSVLVGA
jgi:nitrite reductase (NADH) large subunit